MAETNINIENDNTVDGQRTRSRLIKEVSGYLLNALLLLVLLLFILFAILNWREAPATLPVVFAMGALGSFVSIQRRLKELSIADLELFVKSKGHRWLAPLTGGIMAALLYCLFIAELLSGNLFPTFTEVSTETPSGFGILFQIASSDPKDYAKLVFWSFTAGFSERFVTDIIGGFVSESQTTNNNVGKDGVDK